ncbi:hypothetical protein A2701_03635 [Candidatus Amesbacteria bacterium RIFCSPHIGHO2_01_FULL_47_34]|uniref:DUF559 domain-containing protein n=1 Tax=Candidatus Amesbacteria bacterium RIFCSPLOWO2_01_FULL_47_33 TaxID=1797258 RepID=A0A1F4Z1R3_9BACT|nr:MAG: hypothetical protein A3K03_11935 [Bdellovibrionales bacterium RIFOXYD1_FULL_44_7]OGC98210.1 MAG: hypothetical protein A2701_03635 [Candidatus Amesbacteria bacterium RIFCSPHIGHO2_01_FULL_47_34]OGD00202.1 MAG: hypothetical protein A2972_04900 [Candidatus Amesbacteria bacterium RIFCSPLOWO2_01_FULL_47_33]
MKRFVRNSPELKGRRQELRNRATVAERLLWKRIQRSQLGVKFRRQYSVGNYILDFYCPEKKLAIELDGSTHSDRWDLDEYRTRTVGELGVKVVRFWNEEVEGNIERVMEVISTTLLSPPS